MGTSLPVHGEVVRLHRVPQTQCRARTSDVVDAQQCALAGDQHMHHMAGRVTFLRR
jgi:hypothetical protein